MTSLASFHHIQFVVSNALQASFWYCVHFGFERFAEKRASDYRQKEVAIRNGKIIFVFKCPLTPSVPELTDELAVHGDFVKDVAYGVDDIETVLAQVTAAGGTILKPLETLSDEHGSIRVATIASFQGDLVHTLIEDKESYAGIFLPGFTAVDDYPMSQRLGALTNIDYIDHVVENYAEHEAQPVADWYNQNLNLTRFWSIDDKQVNTGLSALKAQIVSNPSNSVQITLIEPVPTATKGRGQIQEYLDFHGGPGIQHVALNTHDIIAVVGELRHRGVEFLAIPDAYYDQLEVRLKKAGVNVEENLADVRKLQLLVDFDESGYLLQTFTKPVQDRPSLFFEIIQRHNFNGFGAGNFKALFEAVEEEQRRRGTLHE
uniref:4-hydroxyphenylpyruvate dioxygenase n=1 Tax=Panagrellus redivivus TaxID=6233 RepID=A0A7E4VHQ2_PANRE